MGLLLLLLTRGEWVAMLCVLTIALYVSPLLLSPSDEWQFMLQNDDYDNFVRNPVLQGDFLFSYEKLYAMATMRKINVYEPLSWLLKAMIVQCAGLNSWAIRVVTL
ncbi:Peptidase m24, partial [Globisporangium polare]